MSLLQTTRTRLLQGVVLHSGQSHTPFESLEVRSIRQDFLSLESQAVQSFPCSVYLILLCLNQWELRMILLGRKARARVRQSAGGISNHSSILHC